MINNSSPRVVMHRGLSLLELTVVIATLLALISVLFVGARAWKRGSDRTACILSLRNVQVATRSYQNLYGYDYGGHPYAENGTQDIAEHLYAKGYIESALYKETRGQQQCPSGGSYSCPLPNVFPLEGQLYMECSLAGSDKHVPQTQSGW
ncbi:MAG: type II secretion system protein [Luteolibacter sp.]|uniref:type II secretion system protein n=1 Tax=Luteolibacter sp. TaxID=1962973 RepID=UPI0032640E6A